MDHLLMLLLLLWSSELQAEGNHTSTEHVRLVGGASRCDGTLELKHEGDWRPAKDFSLTMKTADVICRDLDCGSAVSFRDRKSSERSVWTINSDCVESGSALRDCLTSESSSFSLNLTCSELQAEGNHTSTEYVRLVGGASRCDGTLEMKHEGYWRPAQHYDWRMKEAAVICRDLDCGFAVSFRDRESSERSVWTINSDCVDSGSALRDCLTSESFSFILDLTCSDSVRLVNGTSLCSGRLEVKSNQSNQWWSSVCEEDFDQQDAEVVCRELGCGAPSVLQGALYGEVEAPMWTKEFQCGGNESALLDCRSSGSDRNTCSPGKAVGLTCSEPVRLVGGASRCAGTLEVKRGGDWRPVEGSEWSLIEADGACRDLDCGSTVSIRWREESKRSVWRVYSHCVQSGSALRDCLRSSSSSSIVVLTCSGKPIREASNLQRLLSST